MSLIEFQDKHGKTVKQNDVVFDGTTYWRMNYNDGTQYSETYLLSCIGYTHDLTQSLMNRFELIGTFNDNRDKFQCD